MNLEGIIKKNETSSDNVNHSNCKKQNENGNLRNFPLKNELEDLLNVLSNSQTKIEYNKKNTVVCSTVELQSKPQNRTLTSHTLLIKEVPKNILHSDDIQSHFSRYGVVDSVECVNDCHMAFIKFSDERSAHRAFVNRLPVMRDASIRLYMVPNHDDSSRNQAVKDAIASPNRKYIDKIRKTKKINSDEEEKEETILYDQENSKEFTVKSTISSKIPKEISQTSTFDDTKNLYDDIIKDLSNDILIKNKSLILKRKWEKDQHELEKSEVVRAKQLESLGNKKILLVQKEVNSLIIQLKKQKEQLNLIIANDGATIDKKICSEFMENINLLKAQLKSAQGSMASAQSSVAQAKKILKKYKEEEN